MQLYSGQFILSREHIEIPHVSNAVIGDWNFYIEENSNWEHIQSSANSIIIVGYAFHCIEYKWQNSQISSWLVESENLEELFQKTYYLAGTYLIVFSIGGNLYVIPDCCALKECYISNGVVASQPQIIGSINNCSPNKGNAAFKYFSSEYFKEFPYYPFMQTHLEGVSRLTPNHYADLNNNDQKRFFPNKPIEPIGLEEGKQLVKNYGRNILKSIKTRYKTAISLTAGWDTRLLLALSRPYSDELEYFTNIYRSRDDFSDYFIPKKLANELGLKNYRQYDYSRISRTNKQYNGIYLQNHQQTHQFLNYIRPKMEDKAMLSGILVNILRTGQGKNIKCFGWRELVVLFSQKNYQFVNSEIQQYVSSIRHLDKLNINIHTLFYWEIIESNRMAKTTTLYNYCQINFFLPFNCHAILHHALLRNHNFGEKYTSSLFRDLFREEIPEAENVPLNPGVKEKVGAALQKMGAFNYVLFLIRNLRYYYRKMRNW